MPRRRHFGDGILTDQPIDMDDFCARLGLGSGAQAVQLLRLFSRSTAGRMDTLNAAIEAQDRAVLRIEAHALKGAARNASATTLAAAMADLEASAAGGDWPELAELARMGDEALAAVDRFIDDWEDDGEA